MIELKSFVVDSTPKKEELEEAQKIAIEQNCIVELKWFVQYSGWHNRYINKDTDIEKLNEQLRHIIYGL